MNHRLILCHDNQKNADKLGADFAESIKDLSGKLKEKKYDIVGIEVNEKNYDRFIKLLNNHNETNFIVVNKLSDQNKFIDLVNNFNLEDFCSSFEEDDFKNLVLTKFEEILKLNQNIEFNKMVQSEQKVQTTLSSKLEKLISDREKKNKRSMERLKVSSGKIESLKKALDAVHSTKSISEMEDLILSSIKKTFSLDAVKILFSANDIAECYSQAFQVPIIDKSQSEYGNIYFLKNSKKKFTKEDKKYFTQIADGIILAIDRINKLTQADVLKEQWEATFNSIAAPLALCNNKYEIIQTNSSFINNSNAKNLVGKNIFSAFHSINPPDKDFDGDYQYQSEVSINGEQRSFDIQIRQVKESKDSILKLILFRDISEQKKLEQQVFETSKMAELGTIGSSIAHEINNPLGGMISFLQLIRMDIDNSHKVYDDIMEMDKAANKCKEIVEDLLGFSRQKRKDSYEQFELISAIEKAVKISELQTRSTGVNVDLIIEDSDFPLLGDMNLLTQAIKNIIQNANEAVLERLSSDPRYDAQIRIELSQKNDFYMLTITDNGLGIKGQNINKIFNPLYTTKNSKNNSGLGLTVAFQIISNHSGLLEVFSQPNIGTSAKISIKRPD